ncbi:MAG TPA: hypothetical protein VM434_19120, partial [Beijerinckiaceae bacterium]|nr:hypothetical protein [Beijerinckiaceae bacterium]
SGPTGGFALGAALCVAAWLGLVILLGRSGAFHVPTGRLPIPVLTAMLLPPAVFLLLLRLPEFRSQVLAIDPVWLAAVQGLRILGAGFLFVYAFGHLSGIFAHPAGWGDVLVALLAPIAATRLARDPNFLRSAWLWRFHALGLLDFVGAIGSGLLARALAAPGAEPTAALAQFPLLLIPCFAVPLWICLHLAAFAQIREARRVAN